LLITSTVEIIFAVIAALRYAAASTRCPSDARDVCVASAAISTNGSKTGASISGGSTWKWS
jgi:hypothetical protein